MLWAGKVFLGTSISEAIIGLALDIGTTAQAFLSRTLIYLQPGSLLFAFRIRPQGTVEQQALVKRQILNLHEPSTFTHSRSRFSGTLNDCFNGHHSHQPTVLQKAENPGAAKLMKQKHQRHSGFCSDRLSLSDVCINSSIKDSMTP